MSDHVRAEGLGKHFLTHIHTRIRTYIVIYEALYFDVAQGRMNGAQNETRTHLCRFASLAC